MSTKGIRNTEYAIEDGSKGSEGNDEPVGRVPASALDPLVCFLMFHKTMVFVRDLFLFLPYVFTTISILGAARRYFLATLERAYTLERLFRLSTTQENRSRINFAEPAPQSSSAFLVRGRPSYYLYNRRQRGKPGALRCTAQGT